MYQERKLSTADIAALTECSRPTVNSWLRKHDIKLRSKRGVWNAARRERNRVALDERRKDPEFNRKVSEAASKKMTERWDDPEFVEHVKRLGSERMKKKWEDPEFYEHMCKENSRTLKEKWKNPEFREKQRKMLSERSKEWWKDPEYRERVTERSKKLWEDDEYREMMSKKAKEQWADLEYYQYMTDVVNEHWADPENRESVSGENSVHWRGGKSFEPYTPDFNFEFKEYIRNREGRCCFLCGKAADENGTRLDVHHIDYDKENTTEENCVALCKKCHTDTNHTRKKWKVYLNARLAETYILT